MIWHIKPYAQQIHDSQGFYMTKIVLIGAGSLQFGTVMIGDIFTSDHLWDAEIVLNDINNAAAKRTATVAREFMKAHNLEQTLQVESDLRLALPGADFYWSWRSLCALGYGLENTATIWLQTDLWRKWRSWRFVSFAKDCSTYTFDMPRYRKILSQRFCIQLL